MVPTSLDEPTQIGFIVAKTVGNAVTRNLVKRRLREIVFATVKELPFGVNVVVRALPAAAGASYDELGLDYRKAFSAAYSRMCSAGAVGQSVPKQTAVVDQRAKGEDVL